MQETPFHILSCTLTGGQQEKRFSLELNMNINVAVICKMPNTIKGRSIFQVRTEVCKCREALFISLIGTPALRLLCNLHVSAV